MESDDLSPLEISHEDDSLLQNDAVSTLLKNNDDFLFSCSPLHIPRSTECKMEKAGSSLRIGNVEKENSTPNKAEVPDLCVEPQQMKKKKKGRGFNLRKSLAWDRAFFTEEGVLNPAELSWITGCSDNSSGMSIIHEEAQPVSGNTRCLETLKEKTFKELPARTSKDEKRVGLRSPLSHSSVNNKKINNNLDKRDVLSARDVSKSGSKRSGCPQPVSMSATKRAASSSARKTPHKESKLSNKPVKKSNQSMLTSKSATAAGRQLKRNQIPQPPKFQNFSGSRAPSFSGFVAHNTDTLGSVKKSLPAKSSIQQAKRNLTANNVQNRPVSRKDIGTQFDLVAGLSVSNQLSNDHTYGSSTKAALPPSTARNTGGSMQNEKLRMATPSGLRKPSPSLGYFNQHKTSSSHDKLSRVLQPSDRPSSSTSQMSIVGTLNMARNMGLPTAAATAHERATTNENTRISNLSMGSSVPSSIIQGSLEKQKFMLEVHDLHKRSTEIAGNKNFEMSSYAEDMKLKGGDKKMLIQHEFHDQLKEKYDDKKAFDFASKNTEIDGVKSENSTVQLKGASGMDNSNKYQDVDVQLNPSKHLKSHVSSKIPEPSDETCEVDWISIENDVLPEQTDACVYQSGSSATCSMPFNLQVNGLEIPGLKKCNPKDDVTASSNNFDHVSESDDCKQHCHDNKLLEKSAPLGVGASFGGSDGITCDVNDQIHLRVQAYHSEASGYVKCSPKEVETASYVNCEVVDASKSNTLPRKTENSFSHSSCSYKSDVLGNLSVSNNEMEKENAATSLKFDNEIKPGALTIKPPANAVPFSDEWLAALEAAGEDILTMKGGAVQNSPTDKSVPEPSPWSPVRRKNNQGIGPYDCTKYIGNNIPNSDAH